jgi:hypothetical protein
MLAVGPTVLLVEGLPSIRVWRCGLDPFDQVYWRSTPILSHLISMDQYLTQNLKLKSDIIFISQQINV